MTCTIATCKRTPRSPTAMEAAAMTAAPLRNLTAIAKAAMEFPHAMILGCKAMNRPVINQFAFHHYYHHQLKKLSQSLTDLLLSHNKRENVFHRPFIITTTTKHTITATASTVSTASMISLWMVTIMARLKKGFEGRMNIEY